MVAEQVDTSFHSLDDLRSHIAAPVVAMIPRVRTPDDDRRDKRQMHRLAAFAMVAIVIIVSLSWFVAAGNYDLVAFLARRG